MAKESKAAKAGAMAGMGMRAWSYARQVDWPAVWMRAKWLSHHTQRLYSNLSEEERKEFFQLVIPTREAPMVAKEDRGRVQELVMKAFTGPSSGT
jgi:hypothetical protein